MKKTLSIYRSARARLFTLLALAALLMATPAYAVEDYDGLVTAATAKLGGIITGALTPVYLLLIGIAIVVGIGLWLISMSRRKH